MLKDMKDRFKKENMCEVKGREKKLMNVKVFVLKIVYIDGIYKIIYI